jgi:hypothetical protein
MNTRTTKGYGTFGRILGQRKGSKPLMTWRYYLARNNT